jgi:hypothetical protein
MKDPFLDEPTPLGVNVSCTEAYWTFIATHKHPVLEGEEEQVRETLRKPDEVRRSRYDANVFLPYRRFEQRWLCAVVRIREGRGFIVTAYPTDALKSGVVTWKNSK